MSNADIEPVVEPQSTTAPASQNPEPLWVMRIEKDFFSEDNQTEYENTIVPAIVQLLMSYLLSEDENAAAATAHKFDSMYEDLYLLKYNGSGGRKKGWTGYLSFFYETVLHVSRYISYDDPLQDKIVQLLLELRKLPPHSAKIFADWEWVDSTVWHCDPQFIDQFSDANPRVPPLEPSEENLKRNHPDEDPEDLETHEHYAMRWVNYFALYARCLLAGLLDGDISRLDPLLPPIDLALGPEKDRYVEKVLDAHVIAAANNILMVGDYIDAECIRKEQAPYPWQWGGWKDGKGPTVWKQWARRLTEIMEDLERGQDAGLWIREENRATLKDLTVKARAKMAELEPALIIEMEAERRQEARKRLAEEEAKKKAVEEEKTKAEEEVKKKAEEEEKKKKAGEEEKKKKGEEESRQQTAPAPAPEPKSTLDAKSDADSDLTAAKASESRKTKHRAVEFVKGLVKSFSGATSKKETKEE
ncbi:hypothetical protein B0T21DRAFT_346739 [Apiosordaria backusii]|uniref:Uncharacterized protein n=1 Tax=Apiosordaria backusii TaxID=314023 RepID=A0AA40BSD8_9PEZI|nr:hypothetical protein B0T21DRAFT_346739 [Apiosordaria backusii]